MGRINNISVLTIIALGISRVAQAFSPPATTKRRSPESHLLHSSTNNAARSNLADLLLHEAKEVYDCVSIAIQPLFQNDNTILPEDIVSLCDRIDQLKLEEDSNNNNNMDISFSSSFSRRLRLREQALRFQRYEMLTKLMRHDYDSYIATASFLSPSRIPRIQLPNIQDVPIGPGSLSTAEEPENGAIPLVPDCQLEDVTFKDNILDSILLKLFRYFVQQNTNGVTSPKPGILGLLEQGRTYYLDPRTTAEDQQKMVRETLGNLMTPVLPPFYRIFMSGIVPNNIGTPWGGKQIGPWFYAPFLTSFVTPTFFQFLVGPSYVNRRKDGQLGGLVVEKCKFLQESGCKGMCLHICKMPAQQFFKDELGLPLTVKPNFVTQECQWSFGEEPLPPAEDPDFPKGCLVGCESRKLVQDKKADLCSV